MLKWRTNMSEQKAGLISFPTPESVDRKAARLRIYEEAKLILQGKSLMNPTREHLSALYELFHLAAQEAIILEERLNSIARHFNLETTENGHKHQTDLDSD
jgi:hypothetical protein